MKPANDGFKGDYKKRKKEPLLSNVFSYNLQMMKENTSPRKSKIIRGQDLTEDYFKKIVDDEYNSSKVSPPIGDRLFSTKRAALAPICPNTLSECSSRTRLNTETGLKKKAPVIPQSGGNRTLNNPPNGFYGMQQRSSVYSENSSPNGSGLSTLGAENTLRAENRAPPNYSFSPQTPSSPIRTVSYKSKLCSPLTVSESKKNGHKNSYNRKPPLKKNSRTKWPSGSGKKPDGYRQHICDTTESSVPCTPGNENDIPKRTLDFSSSPAEDSSASIYNEIENPEIVGLKNSYNRKPPLKTNSRTKWPSGSGKKPDAPGQHVCDTTESSVPCTPGNENDIPKRTLDFSSSPAEDSSASIYNEIENPEIVGFELDESDIDSDDEADFVDAFGDEPAVSTTNVPQEYATLGAPSVQCSFCHAWMWKEERVNKSVTKGVPLFSICCAKGQINLPMEPPTPSFLWQLHNDKDKMKRFTDGTRMYNSIFAMTSTGGKVDHSINCGGAPYVYRLNGQNHHLFGSLIPDSGEDPKFCQLYIYDTQNEVENRLKWVTVDGGDQLDVEIVEGLTKMLDETNELVKEFRSARDRYEAHGVKDLEIILKVSRSESGRENHVAPSDEVAGIMVGDLDDNDGSRDIIIHSKMNGLERISDIHPKLMSLQYPILFPHGGCNDPDF